MAIEILLYWAYVLLLCPFVAVDCQNQVTIAVHLFYIDGTSKEVITQPTGYGTVKRWTAISITILTLF